MRDAFEFWFTLPGFGLAVAAMIVAVMLGVLFSPSPHDPLLDPVGDSFAQLESQLEAVDESLSRLEHNVDRLERAIAMRRCEETP